MGKKQKNTIVPSAEYYSGHNIKVLINEDSIKEYRLRCRIQRAKEELDNNKKEKLINK